jgi:hypothetical protein
LIGEWRIRQRTLNKMFTLTTYYPAPFGAYDRLRLVPRAALPAGQCNNNTRGTFYFDQDLNSLRICGMTDIWEWIHGVWIQNGNDVFLADVANPNLFVGIGTATPNERLEVNNGNIRLNGNLLFRDANRSLGTQTNHHLNIITNNTMRMTILNNGNVGIGTTAPQATFHVVGTSRFQSGAINTSNEIEVGSIGTGNRFAFIDFIGDDVYTDYGLRLLRGNSGQNAWSALAHRGTGALQMFAQEAAPIDFYTSSTFRMRIAPGGRVGIGTSVPVSLLHVNGLITSAGLTSTGNVTAPAFLYSSDIRLKENISAIEDPLMKLRAMRGVHFDWIETGDSDVGVIAQEIQAVFPRAVYENPDDSMLTVDYARMVPLLIEAIKEQQNEIDALKELLNESVDKDEEEDGDGDKN